MKKVIFLLMMVSLLAISCAQITPDTVNGGKLVDVRMDAIIIPEQTVAKITEAILFDFDEAVIREDQIDKIKKVAIAMVKYPDTVLVLEGFASTEGAEDYNIDLSQDRADAVKEKLVDFDVDANRILENVGYGETDIFGQLEFNRRVLVLSLDDE